ncbi:sugar nucleotide-binding protein [Candidatus Woesebacteria bacterium]|nr:MAG: sugar nucleotide-binding protein [Candidatus Woesebacteria bacterium]
MKKIFVTGSHGLIGSRFVELKKDDYQMLTPEIDTLDLTKSKEVVNYLNSNKPDAIVHFAAYTNVGEAELQRDNRQGLCWKINVDATKTLSVWAGKEKRHFVHISTDMIFPGSSLTPGPYGEKDTRHEVSKNLTWYGYTKLEAEKVVNEYTASSAILRLTYPVRAKFASKLDYIRKPIQLYDEKKLYPLFTDQIVSITYIDEACQVISALIDASVKGIYHACSVDRTTPHELYTYVLKKTRNKDVNLSTTSIDEFLLKTDSPVRYPKYGGLKVEETQKALGMKFRTWKQIVEDMILQGLGEN